MTIIQPNSPSCIFYVIGSLEIGGGERHLSMVSRALVRRGAQVYVYSLAGRGPLYDGLEQNGVTVLVPPLGRDDVGKSLVLRSLRMLLVALHLTYRMLRIRPPIVHFFLPAAYIIGGIAAWIARINVRVMSRRSLNNYQHAYPAMQWIEKRLHRAMDAVLGNSLAVVRQLRDDEGVEEGRLGLIYNGIEIPQGPDGRIAVRSSLGIDDRTLVFIIVANLIPYKGHLDLIEAFSLAGERIGQPWRLLVVGRDDGIEPELRAAARQRNVDRQISFLGARSDIADLFSASDVGLLSSHQEGFSNTILEGMAAALPMIVTNVGGNAEAVVNGETGLVVPPHDPQSFADAIVRLAHDPSVRERYGAAGRRRMEELFLLDACVARYEALYRGLMQGKTPRDIPEVGYGPQGGQAG
jgi:glycosyltransferase involved in cell wall biosynthesis